MTGSGFRRGENNHFFRRTTFTLQIKLTCTDFIFIPPNFIITGFFWAAIACFVIAAPLQAVFRSSVRELPPVASTAALHIGLQGCRLPLRPLPRSFFFSGFILQ